MAPRPAQPGRSRSLRHPCSRPDFEFATPAAGARGRTGREPAAAVAALSGRFGVGQASLRQGGLEQFDGIAGRVIDEDLSTANAGDDVVAEVHTLLAQRVDCAGKIGDFQREPVPSTGFRCGAGWHGLAAAARPTRCAEYEPEVSGVSMATVGAGCISSWTVSYTHLTLPTKRIV